MATGWTGVSGATARQSAGSGIVNRYGDARPSVTEEIKFANRQGMLSLGKKLVPYHCVQVSVVGN